MRWNYWLVMGVEFSEDAGFPALFGREVPVTLIGFEHGGVAGGDGEAPRAGLPRH
ncbi:hypothetical protein ACULNC_10345 [Shigella flexneri]